MTSNPPLSPPNPPWVINNENPPPPPPPPSYMPPRRPRRSTRVFLALTLTLFLLMGLGIGGYIDSHLSNGLSLLPRPTPSSDNASAAKATVPGLVNINVSLNGGVAAGTGMIITKGGEVLTNNHVIEDEVGTQVELASNGSHYSAKVLGWDSTDDIALLQITGNNSFPTVHLGNSSSISVGEKVVALGNAGGSGGLPAITGGTVTGLNAQITAANDAGSSEALSGLIQTNANVLPGDSGGALTTADGTVIGMNTAASPTASQKGTPESYAIPINTALRIVRQIQSGTATTTVHIGDTRALLGIVTKDTETGNQVVSFSANSPAALAGIPAGADITSIDKTAVVSTDDIRAAVLQHLPGATVAVTWTNPDGTTHSAQITLASGPPA